MKFTSKICLSALTSALLLGMSSASFAETENGNNNGYEHHGPATAPTQGGAPALGTAPALGSAPAPSSSYTPGTTLTNLGATLTGTAGAASGRIRYTETSTGGSLQISVRLPVDGTIITNANVANAVVAITINNGDSTLPTYNLVISDVDFAYSAGTTVATESAEFTASASQSATIPYTINLGSGASTFPVLTAGDPVTVTINGTQALTGTLLVSAGHR